jgi:YgiT-type zinc finger domain-containing protein
MPKLVECPMCGESMRVKEREEHQRIPGHAQIVRRLIREWVCPGCDYFEEETPQQEQQSR